MGSKCCKVKEAPEEPMPRATVVRTSDEDVFTSDAFHEKAYQQLRHDFENNLDMFLLNNILMSVMFYENFEKEMEVVREGISLKEQEINDTLIKEYSRQCIITDTMFQKVNQRVRFMHKHGKKKGVVQPLIPMRMYIVQDTIEIITQSDETDHYSNIDKPTIKVMVEQSKHSGYVKLRLIQCPNMKRFPSQSSMGSSTMLYMDGQAAFKNGYADTLENPTPSTSLDSEDSEYDYARVNDARTEQPIEVYNKRSNSGGLPHGCIVDVKFRPNQEELYRIIKYVNSERFMTHFFKTEFPLQIAKGLGYSEYEIEKAMHTATAVYCNRYDSMNNCESRSEIVPAVLNAFPDLAHWSARERKTVVGRPQNILYVFPTKRMVKEVCSQPSVVVPRGYMQKKGDNIEKKCEWEVAFPKAERYILERMAHGQIRCFLFLVILFKSFIEPKTQQRGVVLDHIRNIIYWECENNYMDWPEHRLGNKLKIVLKKMYACLGKHSMMDYFVKGKDVFENIPGIELYKAQEIIHKVLENPVIYAISGLRNLETVTDFPTLDYQELYKLLSLRGEAEKRVAPGAVRTQPTIRIVATKLTERQKWELANREKIKNNKKKQKEDEDKQKTNLNKQKSESIDSIDLQFKPKPDLLQDNLMSQKTFLMFFIAHFLKIVDYSFETQSWNQSLLYLDQIMYLARILQDVDGSEAESILKDVKRKQEKAVELRATEETLPSTPARNSVHFNNNFYVVKNQTLNMNNVTQSFQNNVQRSTAGSSRPTPGSSRPTSASRTPSSASTPQNDGMSFIERNRLVAQENGNIRTKSRPTVRINSTPTFVSR